mmetsp:Transcript_13235/g.33058  ORF Transcript_13235/g.33058 Transcript_13235/m.33058 type:complete len:142 (+) Transcript_13235:2509-2934(+)
MRTLQITISVLLCTWQLVKVILQLSRLCCASKPLVMQLIDGATRRSLKPLGMATTGAHQLGFREHPNAHPTAIYSLLWELAFFSVKSSSINKNERAVSGKFIWKGIHNHVHTQYMLAATRLVPLTHNAMPVKNAMSRNALK